MLRPIPTESGFIVARCSRRGGRGRARVGSVAALQFGSSPDQRLDAAGIPWVAREERGFRYWCRTRLADGTYATRWNAGSDGPIRRDDQKRSCAIAHGHDHGGVHEPPFRAACRALGPRSQGAGRAGEALLMLMKPSLSRRRGGTIASVPTDVVKAFEPIPSALRRLARGGLTCGP